MVKKRPMTNKHEVIKQPSIKNPIPINQGGTIVDVSGQSGRN